MLDHEFKLKPSKSYIAFLTILISMSIVVVLTLDVYWIWRAAGIFSVLLYGWCLLWSKGLLKSQYAIRVLRYTQDGWRLYTGTQSFSATLKGDTTITRWVSILRFRVANKTFPMSVVVFHDALEANQYRQMVVALRMN